MKSLVRSSIFCLLLAGCTGSALRAPFCQSSLSEVPDQYLGTYEVTNFSSNSEFNNVLSFDKIQIQVEKNGISLPGGQVPIAAHNSENMLCEYSGILYFQQGANGGTFQVSRLEASAGGLHVSPLFFDPATLKAQHVNFYIPSDITTNYAEDPHQLTYSTTGFNLLGNALIIDNRSMTAEQLLAMAQYSTLNFSYRRIPAITSKGKRIKFRLKSALTR